MGPDPEFLDPDFCRSGSGHRKKRPIQIRGQKNRIQNTAIRTHGQWALNIIATYADKEYRRYLNVRLTITRSFM